MALFQHSVLNTYLSGINEEQVNEAWEAFTAHFHNKEVQENIRNLKEESYQEGFLDQLFVKILGYTKNPDPNYNLVVEQKNLTDAGKADGALLDDGVIRGVIELKGTETTDLSKVEDQAFRYKSKQPDALYVIISNFEKLRFYIDNAVDFLEFNLFQLSKEEFRVLWLCLGYSNFAKGLPKKIKDASLTEEENVTKKLYKDYSEFKHDIFESVKKHNPDHDPLLLFKKTQKLLDRFLFIFFAEDRNLLPPNSIRGIIKQWMDLRDKYDAYTPLYDRFKLYFGYLNTGRNKPDKAEIFAYNGGLFAVDEVLDNLTIDDDLLYKHTSQLSNYDFVSEVDVNILGHIFEHSLNEIEEINAELKGEEVDSSKTRRKKDGVFYTPKYITKYIVENTVGKLCEEKKADLDIVDERFIESKRRTQKGINDLKNYREWLLSLTICDPACGSGAFLNQALEFLIAEHKYIDELQAKYHGESLVLSDIESQILENNLYGVDINEESVEIAKLSLWLRTAQKGRKLTSLNNHIKCGNSLIDDPDVAGDKAFDWEDEFSSVFENGGFDVVIGNPPYGILIDSSSKEYFENNFPLTSYKINLYVLFIERMLQVFNRGIVHFIIPKSLLFNSYYEGIRKFLIENTEINEIFTITERVFQDAEVGSSLLLNFTISDDPDLNNVTRLATAEKVENFITGTDLTENHKPQNSFLEIPKCEITIVSAEVETILDKLHKLKPMENYYSLKNGLNPGNIKHILIADKKENDNYKPIIWGKDISKYHINWSGDFVNYDEKIDQEISLDDVKSKKGMNKQQRIDFALRSPELFESEKLVVRKTGDSLIACYDNNNFYFDTLVHGIYQETESLTLKYLLGIINSNPATQFYRMLHDIKGKTFAKISLTNLGSFPIPDAEIKDKEKMSSLVDKQMELMDQIFEIENTFQKMILAKFDIEKLSRKLQSWHELTFKQFLKELKKKKVELSLDKEAEWMEYFNEQKAKADELKTQIAQTDAEIDAMVYELYGLGEEEIGVVEGKSDL